MKKDKKSVKSTKSRKKKALGRGLDALFPDINTADTESSEFLQCDIDLIHPNRYQPRRKFSEDELKELSNSIKEQGIIQPLAVRKHTNGYELIAGERRLRAAKMAGLTKVPALIRDISDTELLEMSIVENIQRENLNPIEEGEAYKRLMMEFNLTQEDIAKRMGKSRPAIANFLRLLQLPSEIKSDLADHKISMGHARALLGTESSAQMNSVWKTIVSQGLSVRETERLIKKLVSEKKTKEPPQQDSDEIYFSNLAESLSRTYGTKVQIIRKGKKGRVEMDFYSNDDLDRILTLLKKK